MVKTGNLGSFLSSEEKLSVFHPPVKVSNGLFKMPFIMKGIKFLSNVFSAPAEINNVGFKWGITGSYLCSIKSLWQRRISRVKG